MLRDRIQDQIIKLINEEQDICATMEQIEEDIEYEIAIERDCVEDKTQARIEGRIKSNLLHRSLCTGKPDLFGDEMRWHWDTAVDITIDQLEMIVGE